MAVRELKETIDKVLTEILRETETPERNGEEASSGPESQPKEVDKNAKPPVGERKPEKNEVLSLKDLVENISGLREELSKLYGKAKAK